MQSICNDRIYPYIYKFGKGYGKNNEPYLAYALTTIICFCIIMIG